MSYPNDFRNRICLQITTKALRFSLQNLHRFVSGFCKTCETINLITCFSLEKGACLE